jgi:tetratricopeptide (TPR) repeat protein
MGKCYIPPEDIASKPTKSGATVRRSFRRAAFSADLTGFDTYDKSKPCRQKQKKTQIVSSESAGAQKIAIELEGNPKAAEYMKRYNELVTSTSLIVKELLKGRRGKVKEKKFITEVWGVMSGNLNIKYGINNFNFMSEALDSKNFDCSNSSFLVYDVAKNVGIKMEMVLVPGHVIVKTDNFFFETTNGAYHPLCVLQLQYPSHQILESDEMQAITHSTRGNAYIHQGKPEEAVASFKEAIQLNPNSAEAHHNLGIAYSNQAKYDEAIPSFKKAIETDPKNAKALGGLGNAYFRQGQLDEAVASFKKAIELDPKNGEVHYSLGAVYDKQGKLDEAVASFKEASALDPNSPARLYLVTIYYKQGLTDLAEKLIDKLNEEGTRSKPTQG